MSKKQQTNTQPKRQKSVKACNDCRRRKVKCDGGQPCSSCRRSSKECIFEPSSLKRGATKHYIESLENRIHVIERALNTLDYPTMKLVQEAMLRQQLTEDGTLPVVLQQQQNTALFNQDITSVMDNFYFPPIESNTSSPMSSHGSSFRDELDSETHLKFYLAHIQPYFPLFVPSFFHHTYKAPTILIYAICALAAHHRHSGDADGYYQKVMLLLDDVSNSMPSVYLVQTYLLLVKYLEATEQPAFFYDKSRILMTRAIEMCQMLKLHQLVTTSNSMDPEWEVRKRTLCMVFTYHTLLCVEQGIETNSLMSTIKDQELLLLLPCIFPNETTIECYRYFLIFIDILSQVHQHLMDIAHSMADMMEENMTFLHLNTLNENTFMHLSSHIQYATPQFPAAGEKEKVEETMRISCMTILLHMMYHLNILLLHHRYALLNHEHSYHYQQVCLASASTMTRLVEGLLKENVGHFRYGIRGLPLITYCIKTAYKVLHTLLVQDKAECQRCHHVLQTILRIAQDTNNTEYTLKRMRPHHHSTTLSCQDLRSFYYSVGSTTSSNSSTTKTLPYHHFRQTSIPQPTIIRRIQSIHSSSLQHHV